ncbi:hypothetical protein PJP14_29635, partial [Mycobacterium kansasii]
DCFDLFFVYISSRFHLWVKPEIGSRLTALLACCATTGIRVIGLVLLGAMTEEGKTKIEKFNGSNFAF